MKINNIHHQIFEYTKGQIHLDMPLLSPALSKLTPMDTQTMNTFATDGTRLLYGGDMLERVFRSNQVYLQRLFLHSVLHCLLMHLWLPKPTTQAMPEGGDVFAGPEGPEDGSLPAGLEPHPVPAACDTPSADTGDTAATSKDKIKAYWDLACDISVECLIDGMELPCTKRVLSYQRIRVYDLLKKRGASTPTAVYRLIPEMDYSFSELNREFYTDSHYLWPGDDAEGDKGSPMEQPQVREARKNWEKTAREMNLTKLKRGDEERDPDGNISIPGEELLFSRLVPGHEKKTYRQFLQSFLTVNERLFVNANELDYAYYTLGLSLYGNIPLIELPETSEDSTIRELVIVIDTSFSTKGERVQSFLLETAKLLMERGLFAEGGYVRLLQCDDAIRRDETYKSGEELMDALPDYTVTGGGNTDFRPAFEYIEELKRVGELTDFTGVLYFTDGRGIYPKEPPDYPAAFLFTGPYDREKVPPWAITIELTEQG